MNGFYRKIPALSKTEGGFEESYRCYIKSGYCFVGDGVANIQGGLFLSLLNV